MHKQERSCPTLVDEVDRGGQVWHQTYIPRRLEEVDDHEADYARLRVAGPGQEAEGIYYQRLAGMRDDMSGKAINHEGNIFMHNCMR